MLKKKRKSWKGMFALLSIVLLLSAGAAWSALSARSVAESDPMGTMWAEAIVPKHRAVITYMDSSRNMKTFRGQGADIESNLTSYASQSVYTTAPSELGGLSGGDDSRPFAMTSAAGTIRRNVTLNTEFYGTTEFTNVPEPVLCTAYLTMSNAGGANTAVHLEFTNADGRMGRVALGGAPSPAYKYYFRADAANRMAPETDQNVALDLVAFDWNGDGYTDYVLSYPHTPNGNNAEANTYVALVYVDGKSLAEAVGDKTKSVIVSANSQASLFSDMDNNTPGGKTDVKPAGSSRIAIGDIDGDGAPELALFNTLAGGKRTEGEDDNQFKVFKLSVDASSRKASFNKIYEKSPLGGSYLQNDSVGLAMGDLDGDGFAEICALYAQTNLLYEKAKVYLTIFKWDANAKTLVQKVKATQVAETYDVSKRSEISMSPLDASAADLDGDGCDELVWTSLKGDDDQVSGNGRIRLWVHKWARDDISGTGNPAEYNIAESHGWILNSTVARYSLTTGLFRYPDSTLAVKQPRQIAVAHMGGSSAGSTATCNLDWGLFSWSASSGLTLLGKGLAADLMKVDNVVPRLTAVDLNRESMILGEPTEITVQDNIEPLFVTQAPPKHWDVVSGEFAGVNPSDDGGSSRVDVFFKLPGYATTIDSNSSQESIEMTTKTSTGTFNGKGSLGMSQTFPCKDAVPMFSLGAEYAMEKVNETTEELSWTTSSAFSATAETDDQLYYRCNDYKIWRYPVLYPESQRMITVTDENGNAIQAQNFLQFVVPTVVETVFTPSSGRNISWYEPLHDNLNLFTYPRRLKDIGGFPQGSEMKDPSDPWLNTNGIEIVSGTQQQIGNPDKSSFTASIASSSHYSELDSLNQTVGANFMKNKSILKAFCYWTKKATTLTLDLAGDYSWQTSTTTATNASQMKGFTVSWPGAKNYSNAGGFSLEDQTFYSDIAIYTQDDGAFCIGYAVSGLKSARSRLWGEGSPLRTLPDPGLLLPFRYLTSGADNTTVDRLLVRGVSFENAGTTFDYQSLPGKALPIGTPVRGTFRVINYSFVGTNAPLTVSVHYQPLAASESKPDFAKAQQIAQIPINLVRGREEYPDKDNWEEIAFDWTTPSTPGGGYLHIKLDYQGQQLNKDNDYGYVLVGTYDPNNLPTDSAAASQKTAAAVSALDLAIDSVTVRALNDDDTPGETLDPKALPRDRKMEIECTVKLSATGQTAVKALPNVRLFLFGNERSILGGREVPVLAVGNSWTFRATYDPAVRGNVKVDKLRLYVMSPTLRTRDESDMANNIRELAFTGSSGGSTGGGSSSSCSAGFAPLAIAALCATALLRKKEK